MKDYMHARVGPPCGFENWAYDVELLHNVKAGDRVAADPYGDCSGAPFWPIAFGATHVGFAPFGAAIGDRAADAFEDACLSHDYGYDLIRFADHLNNDEGANHTGTFGGRRAADAAMNEMIGRICGKTGLSLGIWHKLTCYDARANVIGALWAVTQLTRITKGVPGSEVIRD